MRNILRNGSEVLAHVGSNLQRLRKGAGLSQQALAEGSGLSRRMIVSLEAGGANVSLASLDRIAEALGVGFVDLVADPSATARRVNTLAWQGTHADSRAVLLGSVPSQREVQLWIWSLGAGDRYKAEPDPAGWHEIIYVVEGRLLLELQDGASIVQAGEHVIFASNQSYAYVNAGDGVTRFLRNVVA